MAARAKWNMEAEFIQSCNCDFGCPCNFDAYPTHEQCEALNGYRIRRGTFNGTKLDGVKFALGLWWPRAIHEGNGVGRMYIDPAASRAARNALEEIWQGRAGGAVWEIFPKTFKKIEPTRTAKIGWKWKGYDSSFDVAGIGSVQSTHIKNPITGENFEAQVVLPGGLNWRKADVTAIQRWWLKDPEAGWNMAHENVAGFVTVLRFTEKGPR